MELRLEFLERRVEGFHERSERVDRQARVPDHSLRRLDDLDARRIVHVEKEVPAEDVAGLRLEDLVLVDLDLFAAIPGVFLDEDGVAGRRLAGGVDDQLLLPAILHEAAHAADLEADAVPCVRKIGVSRLSARRRRGIDGPRTHLVMALPHG